MENIDKKQAVIDTLNPTERIDLIRLTILDHVFSEIESKPPQENLPLNEYIDIVKKRYNEIHSLLEVKLNLFDKENENLLGIEREKKKLEFLVLNLVIHFPNN